MKSRNVDYIPEVDHLRLLAALLVFSYHYFHYFYGNWQALPELAVFGFITEGHTGVSLFFVLSGFIFMTIAQGSEKIEYRSFLRNRILRIAPLLIVVYFVAISIGRNRFEASDVLYLFFTNLGNAPTSWHFATGPAWSISLEFTFYLIFPLLAHFTKKEGFTYVLKLTLLLLVIKLGAYFASDTSKHMLYSTLVGRLDQFLIGMLAAMVYARYRRQLERHGPAVMVAGGLLVYAAVAVQAAVASFQSPEQRDPFWIFWSTAEALLWGMVIVGYLVAKLPIPNWLNRSLAFGGALSYSFYMWHALVIFTAYSLLGGGASSNLSLLLLGIPTLLASGGVAWLSFVTIERPFLRMRSIYAQSEQTPSSREARA